MPTTVEDVRWATCESCDTPEESAIAYTGEVQGIDWEIVLCTDCITQYPMGDSVSDGMRGYVYVFHKDYAIREAWSVTGGHRSQHVALQHARVALMMFVKITEENSR